VSELESFIADCNPLGWRVRPFWSLFRRKKETGFPDEELLSVYREYGVIPKSSRDDNHNKESEDLSAYQLVNEGCLVANKMKAWQGSIAISRYRGIVSPAYYVYRPLSQEHDQFLHYLLRSEPYIAHYRRISKGVRVNQWDLEHEALRNVPILLPDLATQQAIADFLDHETARIDQLIEKKQRIIELFHQKLESLVHEGIIASSTENVRFGFAATRVSRPVDLKSGASFVRLGLYNRGRDAFKKPEADEEDM
jgi:type I restriction enzyme, S subunit